MMPARADLTAKIVLTSLALCWLGFLGILVVGRRGAAKKETKRDLKSHVGFLFQCIAYALCFLFHRSHFSPMLPMSTISAEILAVFTVAIAFASVWFCYESARALGKQWALAARVIEGHELIMIGPYALVRNPIYLAMLGMLLATGFACSRWPALLAALLIFTVGTAIRIRSEERLLREAFTMQFDEYARRVPSFFPRLLS